MAQTQSLRSTLRARSSLFGWALSVALGTGLGLACNSSGGGLNCAPGTENCECSANQTCYPGLDCVAGFCVEGSDNGTDNPGDGDGDGDGTDNPCDGGQEFCGGKCVDTQSNLLHCGGCDMACDSGDGCDQGSCVQSCANAPCEGFTYCEPDSNLCLPGCEYDDQCGVNEACDYDTHECVCGPDYVLCAGECIYEFDPCEDNCGNGAVDAGEVCDGAALDDYDCTDFGYTGGTLGCLSDCSDFDLSSCSNGECGNGVVEPGEDCDGMELEGETCMTQGFAAGTLACALDCTFDTSACSNMADGGDCCISNGSPGCEVPAIEACVCAIDPYCCDTTWDGVCATQAVEECAAICPP